jgi:serine phosphatase RsbU (regulator of sigma subunit)/anti-sigma regulatory factor (Ser/Thr protein kinase)/putative methionine-R-sulfoxide reductase with GAF domain/PAS domain-containing protein
VKRERTDFHSSISRTALLGGLVLAFAGPAVICAVSYVANLAGKPGPTSLFLIAVLAASATGGVVAGVMAAFVSFFALSYFFVSTHHGFAVNAHSIFALVAFLVAALLVAFALDRERRARDRLRTSTATLRAALDVSSMGAWEWWPASGRVWLSPEAERLTGLDAAMTTFATALTRVDVDDQPSALGAIDRVLTGSAKVEVVLRVTTGDETVRSLEIRGYEMTRTALPAERRLVGVVADVTDRQARTHERERQIASLVEEHSLLASVLEQMPVDVIVAEAPAGTVILDNTVDGAGRASRAEQETVFDHYDHESFFHEDGTPYDIDEWPLVRSLTSGEVVAAETLELRDERGVHRTIEVSSAPIRDASGTVVAGVSTFNDVSERNRRLIQGQFLSELSGYLHASLDYRETLARVARQVVPTLADWCVIDLIENGRVETIVLHHAEPEKVATAHKLRQMHPFHPDAPLGMPAVLRTGHAQLDPSESVDVRELVEAGGEAGPGSSLIVPLVVRATTIGAVTLVTTQPGRQYGSDDLAFVEELARRIAVAIDNARLHREQAMALADAEDARQRTARIQDVTEALSEAATRVDVANVLVREGLVALRAQSGAVLRVLPGADAFDVLAATGYDQVAHDRWSRVDPSGAGPAGEAIRTGDLVVVESSAEFVGRWPQLADLQELLAEEATITAPLIVGNERIGVLHIGFRKARPFDPEELAFTQTLARQCAQALERARLYEEELHAREQAERLAGRLRRLQTVVDATFASGTVDELLERLLTRLREAVESDTASILIVDEKEDILVTRKSLGFAEDTVSRVPMGEGFAGEIGATQRQLVLPDISQHEIVGDQLRSSGVVSVAGVPLIVDGRTIGVVHVGMRTPRTFGREDLLLLRLVAARAAVAIDRAQVHEREHRIAEILQRSLLPERLPAIEGFEAAARYVPGTVGIAVGGDWYDVFELANGSIGVAVGDVVGHGVRAAATMGRLRNVLRAYAYEGFGPAEALSRLNRLACDSGEDVFATVVYAQLSPSRSLLRFASAGHPPPVLLNPEGEVQLLDEGRSLPIGATPETTFTEAAVPLAVDSTIVLYTDGLVERRGESIDVGIDRLIELVKTSHGPVDELADRIVEELEWAEHSDDLALVAVHLEPVATSHLSLRFPARPDELAPMRRSLRAWLERLGAADEEVFDFLVAVNEACSNAVEHPIGRNGGDIGLDAEMADGEVTIVIEDHGEWRPAGPKNDRGRGFEFMRALMQDVDVDRSPNGTHVRLRRRLGG